jgi:p-cumate 2,3-dioxygenase subunit beta
MTTDLSTITRSDVEDFLFQEAALLDAWKLEEWAALFTEDGEYLMPGLTEPNAPPLNSLYLIYDDRHRLKERARRLLSRAAHAEFPHSQTVHLISNVRITDRGAEELMVSCSFIVTRAKGPINDTYPGHSTYRLMVTAEGLRIRSKRAVLALSVLRPHGKVSIIV